MASEGGDNKLSVPKFSSFKSKAPPKEAEDERRHEIRSKHDRDGGLSSQRSGEHHRSRHTRHESHRYRERHRSQSRDKRRRHGEGSKNDATQSGVPGIYLIDVKGDPLIRKYGGVDKTQIPAYYRHGSGRVIGTVGRLIIHRDGPRDQFSLRMPGEGSYTHGDKAGLRTRTARIKARPVRPKTVKLDTDVNEAEGYLSLDSSRKRKRRRSEVDSSADDQPSYRSIEGKAKPRQDSESESDHESDTSIDVSVADRSNPLKSKSMQLSKRVKETPEDIDSWLELADHQDALLKAGESVDHTFLENEVHSFAEIKVSMLESALNHAKTTEDRRRVLVKLMREGVKIWSSKTAARKWATVSEADADEFSIWKTQLDFLTSSIATFQYEDIKKMIFDRLRRVLSRAALTPSAICYQEAVMIFLRATRFVHDAGYQELAVAAWQGLLELNFFRPSNLELEETALKAFHDFWESETPRLGEENAKGWNSFVVAGSIGDPPEPITQPNVEQTSSRDPYKSWGYLEQKLAKMAKMPGRTMDDGIDDDPFRVVMYTDIEPFLFIIPDFALPAVTEQLIDSFLLFSGFPPSFRSSHWIDIALDDHYLTSSLAKIDLQFSRKEEDAEVPQRQAPNFDQPNFMVSQTTDLLFGGEKWFHALSSQKVNPTVDVSWLSEAVRQLVFLSDGFGKLARYYLALRFFQDSRSVKKTARTLLTRFPENAELYNAYALGELGNDENRATTVLATATASSSLSSEWYGFMFYRTWSWIELEKGEKSLAIKRLYCSVDDTLRSVRDDEFQLSTAMLLKAQQTFQSKFQNLLMTDQFSGASTLAECLVLFAYLTAESGSEPMSATQGNIVAAMETMQKVSDEYQSRGYASAASHESVLQFAARILYLNACRGPFRRAYMREQLSRFINIFPQNVIFLSLFEWSDASLRVIDETRDLLYAKALAKPYDCLSSRIFAIQHELRHGNSNTVKVAFENAVSSDVCRNSPVLWISFIRFCHSQKQLRPKAKDVFYRGLRHCPGSKDVMMEAFVTLIRDMESDELKAVYNSMTSKAMRVHVDLEEYLEKRRSEVSRDQRR